MEFHPSFDPPWPDDDEDGISFASQYVLAYRRRTGRDNPGASVQADCAQLERDFGREACVQLAKDTNWEKPPGWLRPKLADRANATVAVAEAPAQTRKSLRYQS